MGFKENLKSELDYKDMKVKELAFASGVNKRTIDQYLSSAAKMIISQKMNHQYSSEHHQYQ